MKTRPIEEIKAAFREMGLTEATWGQPLALETEVTAEPRPAEQVFIRIETTTTPLEDSNNANLA